MKNSIRTSLLFIVFLFAFLSNIISQCEYIVGCDNMEIYVESYETKNNDSYKKSELYIEAALSELGFTITAYNDAATINDIYNKFSSTTENQIISFDKAVTISKPLFLLEFLEHPNSNDFSIVLRIIKKIDSSTYNVKRLVIERFAGDTFYTESIPQRQIKDLVASTVIINHDSRFNNSKDVNVLILNLGKGMPGNIYRKSLQTPERELGDFIYRFNDEALFNNDAVGVFISENPKSPKNLKEVKEQIQNINSDIDVVIWASSYYEFPDGNKTAKFHSFCPNFNKNSYGLAKIDSSGISNEQPLNAILEEFLQEKVAKYLAWELAKKQTTSSKKSEYYKIIKRLGADNRNREESKEIHYLLGETFFSLNSSIDDLHQCNKYYEQAFTNDVNAENLSTANCYEKRKEWLQKLIIYRGINNKPDFVNKVNSIINNQIKELFNNVPLENIPVTSEDYVFCITLASEQDIITTTQVDAFLTRAKQLKQYPIIFDAIGAFYAKKGIEEKESEARKIHSNIAKNTKGCIDKFESANTSLTTKEENAILFIQQETGNSQIQLALANKYRREMEYSECLHFYANSFLYGNEDSNTMIENFLKLKPVMQSKSVTITPPKPKKSISSRALFYEGSSNIQYGDLLEKLAALNFDLYIQVKNRNPNKFSTDIISKNDQFLIHDGKSAVLHKVKQGQFGSHINDEYNNFLLKKVNFLEYFRDLNGLNKEIHLTEGQIVIIAAGESTEFYETQTRAIDCKNALEKWGDNTTIEELNGECKSGYIYTKKVWLKER